MPQTPPRRRPTEISVHGKSRVLLITFDDGARFELPYEYLGVFSNAAEVRSSPTPTMGKQAIGVTAVVPHGQQALRIVFDDDHDTRMCSWGTIFEPGRLGIAVNVNEQFTEPSTKLRVGGEVGLVPTWPTPDLI